MSIPKIMLIAALSGTWLVSQGNVNPKNSQSTGTNLATQDKNFILRAAEDGQREIEIGYMALQRASSSSVKILAQRVVSDDTKANQELETLARQKGVTFPSQSSATPVVDPGRASPAGRKHGNLDKPTGARTGAGTQNQSASVGHGEGGLEGLSGSEFDEAFARQMVQENERAVADFEREQNSTTDPDVREYISTMLPTLRQHLAQARALHP
jgi:putative membrane protein